MDFSEALKSLKEDMIVTNENWNGKGMYIFMQDGYPDGIQSNENTMKGMHLEECKTIVVEPYIMMSNAEGKLVPWTPSQMDLFSDGWINTGPY
jgi:hypothetical protein